MFRGDQKTLNKSRHWEESIRRVHAIHPPQVGLWNAAEGRLLSHSPQRPTLEKQILSAESSLPSFWAARSAWAFFFFPVFHFAAFASSSRATGALQIPWPAFTPHLWPELWFSRPSQGWLPCEHFLGESSSFHQMGAKGHGMGLTLCCW